jgi:PAS domain S-box-containing protein
MLTFEKLLNAINQSIDGIAILDAEGCFQYVNNSHCNLFGYDSIDELLGKHWSVGFNNLNTEHISNEILPIVNSNGHWSGDVIGKKKNGTAIVQSVTITKISEDGILCLCRDETKDVNLGRLEYLTTNLGKGIIVEDEFRKIVLANRQFSNLFQIPFEVNDMLGLKFLDLVKKLIPVINKNYEITSLINQFNNYKFMYYINSEIFRLSHFIEFSGFKPNPEELNNNNTSSKVNKFILENNNIFNR